MKKQLVVKDMPTKCIVNGVAITQSQIDNRHSDYVCWDCGRQFLTEAQKKRDGVVTAHKSACGLCGEEKAVTHIRHWNWLHVSKEAQ